MSELSDVITQKLLMALKAIQEREDQWMHEDNKRYVDLSVREMRYLLTLLEGR